MSKTVLFVVNIFIIIETLSVVHLRAQQPPSNLAFLERNIRRLGSTLLDSLQILPETKLAFSCAWRDDADAFGRFCRDVMLQRLFDGGITVLDPAAAAPKSGSAENHYRTLRVIIEDWNFAARYPAKSSVPKRIIQEFNLQVRYFLSNSEGELQKSGSLQQAARRFFDRSEALEQAQQHAPGFARTLLTPRPGKNDLLSTALITIFTGATIFLIYSLRSQ